MLFKSVLGQNKLSVLLKYNICGCIIVFALLELWRPHYFLTDDNLAGNYPVLIEMGRHMHHGEWPFTSDYVFGGNYDWSRDIGCLCWHPFYFLAALLADTWAKYWVEDAIAFPYLLLTTIGFTILAYNLRDEFKLALSDLSVMFYTASFVFSSYILMVTPSWICFLGNQSALPWLTLGIMDRKITRGVFLVTLVTIHQFVGSYAGMTISNSFLLSFFAMGIAVCRQSPRPFFVWVLGSSLAYLILTPFLLIVLDGFAHSVRLGGFTPVGSSEFSVPASVFPFSYFFGNWTELLTKLEGDTTLSSLSFPFISSLLPCLAGWCLVPTLISSKHWRPLEIVCLAMALLTMMLIIRPNAIAFEVQYIPFLKSLRWPFREILQFLFFIHLLMILRPPTSNMTVRWLIPVYSVAIFLLPLPFIRVPTLNPLALDRQAVISGNGDRFWTRVKLLLKPGDEIATVIEWRLWEEDWPHIPYTYLGTANFPALYQVRCASGYSTTAPFDQKPLKTIPHYWFGAYASNQVDALFRERPGLKLIVLRKITPLEISLVSKGQPPIDLTPYLAP